MRSPHRAVPAAPLLAVLLLLGACTGDAADDRARPRAPASPTPTGQAPSLRERAAPLQVRFRRVAGGDLAKRRRADLLRAVSRPVRSWLDGGFVAGPWPRTEGFRRALVPFGGGIIGRARKQSDLLTLRTQGPSLADVVPQRRRVAVSVTMARGRVAGATARVDLRVLGLHRDGSRQRVRLRGDVYLTRTDNHGWRIFGYDVDRWAEQPATAVPSGGSDGSRRSEGGGA